MRIGRHIIILSDMQMISVFVALMIALAVCAYVVVSGSVVRHAERLSAQIKNEEAVLTAHASYYRARERLLSDREATAPFFSAPAGDEKKALGDFLRTVEALAKKSRLTVVDISPKEKVDVLDGVGRVYRLSFAAEGLSASLFSFLADIDGSESLIAFDTVAITVKDDSGAHARIDGQLSLTAIDR